MLFGRGRRLDDIDGGLHDRAKVDRLRRRACSLPLMMRAMSSRSSMRRICDIALRSMTSSACRAISASAASRKDLRPAEHGVERRPDFVRERREELVFQSATAPPRDRARSSDAAICVRSSRSLSDALADVFDDVIVPTTCPSSRAARCGGLRHLGHAGP